MGRCMVCLFPIEKDNETDSCPDCETVYHRGHILEWLKINRSRGRCPICCNEIASRVIPVVVEELGEEEARARGIIEAPNRNMNTRLRGGIDDISLRPEVVRDAVWGSRGGIGWDTATALTESMTANADDNFVTNMDVNDTIIRSHAVPRQLPINFTDQQVWLDDEEIDAVSLNMNSEYGDVDQGPRHYRGTVTGTMVITDEMYGAIIPEDMHAPERMTLKYRAGNVVRTFRGFFESIRTNAEAGELMTVDFDFRVLEESVERVEQLDGEVSDIRMENRALTPEEIQERYDEASSAGRTASTVIFDEVANLEERNRTIGVTVEDSEDGVVPVRLNMRRPAVTVEEIQEELGLNGDP